MFVDPEISPLLQPLLELAASARPLRADDVSGRRARIERSFERLAGGLAPYPEVAARSVDIPTPDGRTVPLRIYRSAQTPRNANPMVYMHGGGRFSCTVDIYDRVCRRYAAAALMPIVAVDYRRPPEVSWRNTVSDGVAALRWVASEGVARVRGWSADNVIVGGDSGGAGLAVAVAAQCRDRDQRVGGLMLVYPMLDDRTPQPPAELARWLTWSHDDNEAAWRISLTGLDPDEPYAVPARMADVSGLPPTYLEVGSLDLFHNEVVAFAGSLRAAGVQVELRIIDGAPHAFDLIAPHSAVTAAAIADRSSFLLDCALR